MEFRKPPRETRGLAIRNLIFSQHGICCHISVVRSCFGQSGVEIFLQKVFQSVPSRVTLLRLVQTTMRIEEAMMLREKPFSIQRSLEVVWRQGLRRNALCSALAFGIAAVAGAMPALAASTLVTAPDGTFEGKFDATGAMREFLGIRYAQPPIGNLRWKPTQHLTPAAATQDATNFGSHCPQPPSFFGNAPAGTSEDCLFL